MMRSKHLILMLMPLMLRSLPVVGNERKEDVVREHVKGVCKADDGRGFFQTVSKNGGNLYCCNCPAGTSLINDGSDPCKPSNHGDPHPECLECHFDENDPHQQFWMDVENNKTECYKSLLPAECQKFMNTHRQKGSRTENAKCVCNEGYHSASGTEDVSGGCHPHSLCIEGFQSSTVATATSDTQCEICPDGTFSNVSSPVHHCIPWTACKSDEEIVFGGNGTHDRVCKIENGTPPANYSDPALVTETAHAGSSVGVIVGIVLGVIAAVVITGIAVFCCCCRGGKKTENLNLNDQPERAPMIPEHQPAGNGGLSTGGGDGQGEQTPVTGENLPANQTAANGDMNNGRQPSFEMTHIPNQNNVPANGNGENMQNLRNEMSKGDDDTGPQAPKTETTKLTQADPPNANDNNEQTSSDGGPNPASTSTGNSQDVEKGQKKKKQDSSSPSDDSKAFRENGQGFKDRSSLEYIDEIGERSESGQVSEESSTPNQANPPNVVVAQNQIPAQPNIALPPQNNPAPLQNNPAPQQNLAPLDKQHYLQIFANFVNELNIAEQNGCHNCCLEKGLKDSIIGKAMLLAVEELDSDAILPLMRLFLTNTQIKDIRRENIGSEEKEVRHQWILKIHCVYSRDLTPEKILDKTTLIENNIREQMFKKFFDELAPCH